MPKHANPSSTGRSASQTLSGQVRFATSAEAVGTRNDIAISPATLAEVVTTMATTLAATAAKAKPLPAPVTTPAPIAGAATKLPVKSSVLTDFVGKVSLVKGVATVENKNISANDRIFLTRSAFHGATTLGFPVTSIKPGISFTITSVSDKGMILSSDTSTFDYFIARQT